MSEIISKELSEIEARANAATSGQAQIVSRGGTCFGWDVDFNGQEVSGVRGMFARLEDAEFFAQARSDVLRLVAEVRQLQAKIRGLEAKR